MTEKLHNVPQSEHLSKLTYCSCPCCSQNFTQLGLSTPPTPYSCLACPASELAFAFFLLPYVFVFFHFFIYVTSQMTHLEMLHSPVLLAVWNGIAIYHYHFPALTPPSFFFSFLTPCSPHPSTLSLCLLFPSFFSVFVVLHLCH